MSEGGQSITEDCNMFSKASWSYQNVWHKAQGHSTLVSVWQRQIHGSWVFNRLMKSVKYQENCTSFNASEWCWFQACEILWPRVPRPFYYVIQHVLKNGRQEHCCQIITHMRGKVLVFSQENLQGKVSYI